MSLGDRTFVGFGFGPIQSGLFCYEAWRSGNFGRFVVAEVDADLVAAVRANGGAYLVNIARADRVDTVEVPDVELVNPRDPAGRATLIDAIASADELATCLPSIDFYTAGSPSVVDLLAEGLSRRDDTPAVLYAAENHNHAAEALHQQLTNRVGAVPGSFQVLNTVIGKMSGVIADTDTIDKLALTTLTPDLPRAVLVEEFNRILISEIKLPGFRRGIDVFAEKPALLPFEEAKLFGHNAIHALMGYLADLQGLDVMAQVARCPDILAEGRAAFLEESGAALCRRYADLGEALFTPEGYGDYAEDLLDRMVRPTLHDLVARVTRDHVRKLGWDDRLFGTMRVCLAEGVTPVHLAGGAAAGVASLVRRREEISTDLPDTPDSPADLTESQLAELLRAIWGHAEDPADTLIDLTCQAYAQLDLN